MPDKDSVDKEPEIVNDEKKKPVHVDTGKQAPIHVDTGKKTPIGKIEPKQIVVSARDKELSEGISVQGTEDPKKIVRQGMWLIFIFFGIFGAMACFCHISGAVVAPGRIKLESERKIIQHLEGGIVEDILVHEGEEVKAGQILVVLKSVSTDANKNMQLSRDLDLELKKVRLIAEKEDADKLVWPKEVMDLAKELNRTDAMLEEEKVFLIRQTSQRNSLQLLNHQIEQYKAQLIGYESDLNGRIRVISALREELAAKRKMLAQHFIDKPQVLSLERELASSEGTRGKLQQNIAETKQKISETRLKVKDTKTKFVQAATEELAQVEKDLIQAREQVKTAIDSKERLNIVAPVEGKVVDLKIHSKGGVINRGEVLMDIVPLDQPLVVDAQVPVNKITEVYVGQKAEVSLDAFNVRMTPRMPGKVTYISADRLEQSGNPYYLCYVEVDPKAMEKEELYIVPGMPATVYIMTQDRTIIYYIMEPLIKAWERSLRD